MIIFSVDSASVAGSAALVRDGEVLYECFAKEGLTHSETLLERCDEVFRKTGCSPKDVDCYAVTCGPGSFTGLRIGINLVKGLAFPADTPCVPVSTFEALANPAIALGRDILCVLDARQKRVYCAAYHVDNGELVPATEGKIVAIRDLNAEMLEAGIHSPVVVGDMAEAVSGQVEGSTPCLAEMQDVHAAEVGRIAYKRFLNKETVRPEELVPVYLQLSQAERERIGKENK